MKKIIIIVYLVLVLIISIVSTVIQSQPALMWINIFAPEEGDEFNLKLVWLLTMLELLMPLLIYRVIEMAVNRSKESSLEVAPGSTGIWVDRKKQFQSALVSLPVLVNGKKVGVITNGRGNFFMLEPGYHIVQVDEGIQGSDKHEIMLKSGQQAKYAMEIRQNGLVVKYHLTRLE
jgi:hypothetical protein